VSLKLNMLPPSVNNMSVRVFVRAVGLPVEEENVWGQTQGDEYTAKVPSGLTPSIESDELPKGTLWESCAVMMYLASRERRDDL
jgi:glutathione S-transferase